MKTQSRYVSYIYGYVISLILTFDAYIAVTQFDTHLSSGMILLLVCLAALQLIAQSIFFLHLGRDAKPRWSLQSFIITGMVLLFIVIGSIWIMDNLNYNMMGHHAADMMMRDEGLRRE